MTATLTVRMARNALVGTARTLLSLRAIDLPPPGPGPRIYVANHVSHADFVALWSVLPNSQRLRTRPVSSDWMPDSPNATVLPRTAMPLVRPLNVFRNLTRFGASIGQFPVL